MRLQEKESDGEKGMEKLVKENLHLDKALAVIWSEIHCLHDDIEFMMDLIRNVNEHVRQTFVTRSHVSSLPQPLGFQKLCLGKQFCSYFHTCLTQICLPILKLAKLHVILCCGIPAC